jgi:predicted negative regulator of RcsB-dependent stress response
MGQSRFLNNSEIGLRRWKLESNLLVCYYREGLFDVARLTLKTSLTELPDTETELRAVALIRLASVERHAGRLHDALALLDDAAHLATASPAWTNGRFHSELATTLNHLAIAESRSAYFERALGHYSEASAQFEQIGNFRYVAAVEKQPRLSTA